MPSNIPVGGPAGSFDPTREAYAEQMSTIFTRILDGEIPGTFVWRDDRCAAFMSINPMAHGHTLVVPIDEVEHWIDLDAEVSNHLFGVARSIALAQQAAFSPTRVGLIIAGYEVPHTHIHVIPTDNMNQLSFASAATSIDRSALDGAAEAIRRALIESGHEQEVSR